MPNQLVRRNTSVAILNVEDAAILDLLLLCLVGNVWFIIIIYPLTDHPYFLVYQAPKTTAKYGTRISSEVKLSDNFCWQTILIEEKLIRKNIKQQTTIWELCTCIIYICLKERSWAVMKSLQEQPTTSSIIGTESIQFSQLYLDDALF